MTKRLSWFLTALILMLIGYRLYQDFLFASYCYNPLLEDLFYLFLKIFRLLLLAGLICFFYLLVRNWQSLLPLRKVLFVLLTFFASLFFWYTYKSSGIHPGWTISEVLVEEKDDKENCFTVSYTYGGEDLELTLFCTEGELKLLREGARYELLEYRQTFPNGRCYLNHILNELDENGRVIDENKLSQGRL